MAEVNSFDTLNKFLTTIAGRDRTNRFIQYLCKLLLAFDQFSPETVGKLTALQSQATNTRKFMRIFRQLEFYKLAQKAASAQDDVTRLTTILKNIGMAVWLMHDTIGWAHNAKLVQLNDVKSINNRGFRFWLFALVASWLNGIHRLRLNSIKRFMEIKYLNSSVKKQDKNEIQVAKANLENLKLEKSNLMFTTVQDTLDIFIPASNLGLISLDQKVTGLIGVITSIMGGYTHWKSL